MTQALAALTGLVLVFALTALFCSAIVESIANVLERRAQYLITALRNMLDTPESGKARADDAGPSVKTLHDSAKTGTLRAFVLTSAFQDEAAQAATVARTTVASAAGAPLVLPVTRAEPQAGTTSIGSLTATFLAHPTIRSLQTRRVRLWRDGAVRNPQYIPASTFARVLIATLLPTGADAGQPDVVRDLRAVLTKVPDTVAAKKTLLTLLDQAGSSTAAFQKSLEEWYDAQMGRISGWYKRWARQLLLAVGLVVAVVLNIDAVQVGHTLWVDEAVREAVVTQVEQGVLCADETDEDAKRRCSDAALARLQADGLPIGPSPGCGVASWAGFGTCFTSDVVTGDVLTVLAKLLGWLLTAYAVSFGAPFWFDALSKLGNLRGTGPKPDSSVAT